MLWSWLEEEVVRAGSSGGSIVEFFSVLTHFESSENRTRRALRAERGVCIEMRVNLLVG